MTLRRLFVPLLRPGVALMDAEESHHAQDVLRLGLNDVVELFDLDGNLAQGRIVRVGRQLECAVSDVRRYEPPVRIAVASAVPKGDRADWLVEKLSELGVTSWTPLRTVRSVVHPTGAGKTDRWKRIAIEAAKQSRRAGVMRIEDLTDVDKLVVGEHACTLSTRERAQPMAQLLAQTAGLAKAGAKNSSVQLLIGPEGGWTDDELGALAARGAIEASLTRTVLRIETAAIAAAALAACLLGGEDSST